MDFPSHISAVSDICGDLTDFDDMEEEAVKNDLFFELFVKESLTRNFVSIFGPMRFVKVIPNINSDNSLYMHISFIASYKLYTIVYSMKKIGIGRWSARFEPFICSPQPEKDTDVSWIRFAFVSFEPAFMDYETALKDWFESKAAFISYSNMISSLNFQYS